ncbi:MAG: lysophospholipid acyltransferase family protein [Desulfosarcina sp.]|jgi:putative hemolysin
MQNGKQTRMTANETLIQFGHHISQPLIHRLTRLAFRPLARMMAIDAINSWYDDLVNAECQGTPFSTILGVRDISYQVTADDLAKIPRSGPLVVVANHPFGGLEGIVLGDLLQRVRPDTKILGNYLLQKIEPIRDSIIPIDPFGRKSSVSSNAKTFRTCLRWLKGGNCLVTFPAGEVAHYRFRQHRITDPPWSSHVAAMVRMSGAQVLPIYFPGRNSLLFTVAGLIHPRLRTAMLGRELVAKQASLVRLFVGQPIAAERIQTYPQDQELIRWLRFKTYFQANRLRTHGFSERLLKKFPKPKISRPGKTLVESVSDSLLAAEVAALPKENRLLTHKQMAVYVADSEQIPHLLREIGRLREKTFREVGEGTGRSMDVDLFDSYYRHLILWNSERSEVVGAYRMGDTGSILARFGRKGLYTHSLFRFKHGLLQYLTNSLELGRSFIRSKYQRQPNCLSLLWKGIGAYLIRHPQYRILFGPVSISNSYHRVSKHLMVQFLRGRCTIKKLSAYVSPRKPLRQWPNRSMHDIASHLSDGSIDDVSMLVSEIEDDGKRVPILIKHYLKLNGQFIAFNVDRDFADAIDGLVVVDLMQTDTKLLDRFMGRQGSQCYRERWENENSKLKVHSLK